MAKKPTYEELQEKLQDLEEKDATRKLLEKYKKELEAQLQKSFAAGIAHDFNNLLMAVQANISMLLLDMEPTHPHYKRLIKIEEHIQSGARLTSRLLIQAREEKFEIKPLLLNQLVEETVDSFCATQKNTTINLKFDKKLYLVKANSSQIEQLFYNLLTSLTTGPDAASAVTISTANTSSQNMEGKKYDPIPGNYVLLTVQAKDKYISKEKVERIFEPLLSTHGDKEPPDLGLASIYSTIKSYGGYIDIEQNKEKGAIFFIYLPATNKKLSAIIESTEKFIKEKGTILLVDDEEAFLEVGRELIEALGYNVMIAKNGKEAVEIFKKNKAAIGLVLLDIIMPIMDGSEAFDQLRKIDPEVKVLLASGYSKDGAAKEILNRGCNGFIQKPFKMRDLSEKLTEIIAHP